MTEDLLEDQQQLQQLVCQVGGTQSIALDSKGVGFGVLHARRTTATPCEVRFDTDDVRGVDFLSSVDNPAAPPELIVRPFQWKGSVGFLRDFNRGASHNELGMQSVEIVGDDVDGDFDGVTNELTIGDQTALAIYLAGQPRPTSKLELNALGILDPPLSAAQIDQIARGRQVFDAVACGTCHLPALPIESPVFSEPSQNAAYRDGATFPAGQNPLATGVDPSAPVSFDLTLDQPDNHILLPNGQVYNMGALRRDGAGPAIVELYGDLKRHLMGRQLAEPVNEIAGDDVTPIPVDPRNRHSPETFLTENLWGVGSTAPYMHDGRATTLAEAILEHATADPGDPSEAAGSRRLYLSLSPPLKADLIAFLDNLVLFKLEEEEEDTASAAPSQTGESSRSGVRRVKIGPRGFRFRVQ